MRITKTLENIISLIFRYVTFISLYNGKEPDRKEQGHEEGGYESGSENALCTLWVSWFFQIFDNGRCMKTDFFVRHVLHQLLRFHGAYVWRPESIESSLVRSIHENRKTSSLAVGKKKGCVAPAQAYAISNLPTAARRLWCKRPSRSPSGF